MNYIKSSHQIAINRVLSKAVADARVIGVVLYGSALVKPNYRDIDLCIISEEKCDTSEIFKEYMSAANEPLDIRIFADLPLYIQARVMKEGHILLQKDYDRLFTIYMNAIRSWNDFEPRFHMYLEAVKHG